MNRFINMLLLVLFFPTMFLSIYVSFDLPIGFLQTSGAYLPYKFELFLGLGLLLFVINLRRSIRRWMGMRIVSKKKKFKWNAPVSASRKKRVVTYLLLETLVMTSVAFGLYRLTNEAWMPTIAFLFGATDNIIFAIIGTKGNLYRIGLSSKALIVADRDVTLLYFTGLRKVSIHQQSIYFDYIKGLQLSFPSDCIEEENRSEFFELLEAQLDKDRVFFSKTLV